MPYAVGPEDIEARWRPLSSDERSVAQELLDDAAVLLDTRLPTLAALVAAGAVSQRLVVIALTDAVQRVLRNPDVQASLSIGADGTIGQSFGAAAAAARPRLELTDADLAPLAAAVGGESSQASGVSSRAHSVPLL